MLDSILKSRSTRDTERLYIQKILNRGLTRFLNVFIPIMVIATPFLLALRSILPSIALATDGGEGWVVVGMLGVAWIVWLSRGVFAQDRLVWRTSLASWLLIILGVVVLALSLVHGFKGSIAWFTFIGFTLLLLQEVKISITQFPITKKGTITNNQYPKSHWLLKFGNWKLGYGYYLTYILIALYMIAALYPAAVSIIRDTPTIPAQVAITRYVEYGISHFGAFGTGLSRGTLGFWELGETVNIRGITAVPALPNIYTTLLWEGGFALILVFILLGLVQSLYSLISSQRALRRLGPSSRERGGNLAIRRFSILLLLWLVLLWWIPYSFMSLLVITITLPLLYSGGLPNHHTPPPVPRRGPGGGRVSLKPMPQQPNDDPRLVHTLYLRSRFTLVLFRLILVGLMVMFVLGMVAITRRVYTQTNFRNAFSTTDSGISANLTILEEVIYKNKDIPAYRVSRANFVTQALIGFFNASPTMENDAIDPFLRLLDNDFSALRQDELDAFSAWQLAWNAEQIAFGVDRRLLVKTGGDVQHPELWYNYAQDFYNQAIARLPRNVILLTDVSRAIRLQKPSVIASEATAERGNPNVETKPNIDKQRSSDDQIAAVEKRARELLDRAIEIDPNYLPAYFEKAELELLQNNPKQAFELVRNFELTHANDLYIVGRYAFAALDYAQAEQYFTKAINQNENHLQARFDLIQAYIALTDLVSAFKELEELETLVPEDDVQTRELLSEFREMLGE